MKRFIGFASMGIIAVLCMVMCGVYFSEVDTVSENAMGDYGSCETHLYANNGEYTVIKEANCTSKGTQYRSCIVCGYKDIVEIPKDPDAHSQLSSSWFYSPAPTCSNGGVQYKICYGCNESAEVTDVPADPEAHEKNGDYVVISEATCASVGEKAYQCKHCNTYFGNAEIPVNSENHVVTENSSWQVIKLPGCAEEGTLVAFCDFCGREAEKRTIPATGEHTPSDEWTVDTEPTCSSDGVMSRHCTVCDAHLEETVIPASPDKHTFADEYTIDKDASCVSVGLMSKHCLYCDAKTDVYEINIDPDAHSYTDEWIVTKEPSCYATGLKHRVCILCNKDSVPTIIEKTAHSYPEEYEIIRESADGLSAQVKYICTECEYEYVTIITFGDNNGNGNIGDGTVVIYKIIPADGTVIKVDYDNQLISNVAKNMTVEKFLSNFTNSSVFVIYDEKSNFINEEDYIGTGCRLNFETVEGKVTNYYVSVTGDLDSDGKVTASDARLVLRAAARLDNLNEPYFTAADVNLDGKVLAADARKTLLVAAGIEYFDETYEY